MEKAHLIHRTQPGRESVYRLDPQRLDAAQRSPALISKPWGARAVAALVEKGNDLQTSAAEHCPFKALTPPAVGSAAALRATRRGGRKLPGDYFRPRRIKHAAHDGSGTIYQLAVSDRRDKTGLYLVRQLEKIGWKRDAQIFSSTGSLHQAHQGYNAIEELVLSSQWRAGCKDSGYLVCNPRKTI